MNSSHYKSPSTKSTQLFHGSLALVLGCLSAVLLLEQLLTFKIFVIVKQSSAFLDMTRAVFCRIEQNLDSELPDLFP